MINCHLISSPNHITVWGRCPLVSEGYASNWKLGEFHGRGIIWTPKTKNTHANHKDRLQTQKFQIKFTATCKKPAILFWEQNVRSMTCFCRSLVARRVPTIQTHILDMAQSTFQAFRIQDQWGCKPKLPLERRLQSFLLKPCPVSASWTCENHQKQL